MTATTEDTTDSQRGEGVSPGTAASLRNVMDRLLSGRPRRTDGRLTTDSLWKKPKSAGHQSAMEAGRAGQFPSARNGRLGGFAVTAGGLVFRVAGRGAPSVAPSLQRLRRRTLIDRVADGVDRGRQPVPGRPRRNLWVTC